MNVENFITYFSTNYGTLIYMLTAIIPQIIEFDIDPRILWLLFIIAMIFFTILSAILVYHWYAYSFARKQMNRVAVIFFSVSGLLILVSIGAATAFTLS